MMNALDESRREAEESNGAYEEADEEKGYGCNIGSAIFRAKIRMRHPDADASLILVQRHHGIMSRGSPPVMPHIKVHRTASGIFRQCFLFESECV